MNHTIEIHTFGCKVNTYDSGLIEKNLLRFHALNPSTSTLSSKIHILNTCAVTSEATKEAARQIRRFKARDPFCTVVVTGCAAQVDTDTFTGLSGADLVVANSHKSSLPEILTDYFKGTSKERVFKSNIFRKEDLELGGGKEKLHTRSFLKIQDGCNSFCTYCIIPYARGKSRSLPMKALISRVNDLYAEGIREVVLTGVHIGDYEDSELGLTNKPRVLEDLIEALLKQTKMPRFRLTSFEPPEISGRLLELFSDQRLCPHFHMSIQSANNVVLKDMKRNYSQKEIVESLTNIRAKVPNAFIGMDVIVGFPTESEAYFQDTYNTLKNLPWSRIHVFPYSERPGTRAAAMIASVPLKVRQARGAQLRGLSDFRYQEEAIRQIGTIKDVLFLGGKARGGNCLSQDYWPIRSGANSEVVMPAGQLARVKISAFRKNPNSSFEGYLEGDIL